MPQVCPIDFGEQGKLFRLLVGGIGVVNRGRVASNFIEATGNGVASIKGATHRTRGRRMVSKGNGCLSPNFVSLRIRNNNKCSTVNAPSSVIGVTATRVGCNAASVLPAALTTPVTRLGATLLGVGRTGQVYGASGVLNTRLRNPFLSPRVYKTRDPRGVLIPSRGRCRDLLSL